jgi:DNA polymerase-3 subunit delta
MVAVKAQTAASFIKSPDPRIGAFLLFGTDEGMISERASTLAKTISARETPPGEIIQIDENDLDSDNERLAIELQTVAMFGGRKVVRTSIGRRINAQYLKPLIEKGNFEATLIVEASNLKFDDTLRGLFERSSAAAAIACYPDEARDLDALVREVLGSVGLEIAPEAKDLLLSRLGADRALSRNEIEKLALYAAGRGRIEAEDVDAVVGDASELALDKVVMAAASGDTARALAEIERATAAGENAQTVLLAMQRYVQRLHRLRAAIEAGRSLDDVIRGLRPPVHFKARPALEAHCQNWSGRRLDEAQSRIASAAKAARLGGNLEQALVERALIEVARLARVAASERGKRPAP